MGSVMDEDEGGGGGGLLEGICELRCDGNGVAGRRDRHGGTGWLLVPGAGVVPGRVVSVVFGACERTCRT